MIDQEGAPSRRPVTVDHICTGCSATGASVRRSLAWVHLNNRVPKLRERAGHLKEERGNAIIGNPSYAHEHGMDRPEIADWTWPD